MRPTFRVKSSTVPEDERCSASWELGGRQVTIILPNFRLAHELDALIDATYHNGYHAGITTICKRIVNISEFRA